MKRLCIFPALNRRARQEQVGDPRIGCGLLQHLNASFTVAMPLKKHTYNLRDNKPHWLFAVTAEF